jgi:hypothetical protein
MAAVKAADKQNSATKRSVVLCESSFEERLGHAQKIDYEARLLFKTLGAEGNCQLTATAF